MKRKLAALGMSLAMVLTLTACGTQAGQGGADPAEASPQEQTEPEVPTASTGSAGDDIGKAITAETAEAKGLCGADLAWYYQDNTLVIRGTGEMTSYGNSYGDDVPWYDLRNDIARIIVEDGCTSIGDYAFYKFKTLSSVTLADSVTSIGKYAFEGASNLPQITLPQGVQEIGSCAFEACNELKTVIFLGDAPEGFIHALGGSSDAYTAPGGDDSMSDEENKAEYQKWIATAYTDITIYYSGDTFAEWIEAYPGINWIQQ